MRQIYIIGSLRNPEVPRLAHILRREGYDVFDDWYSAGPEADDKWQEYEQARERSYHEALNGYHAKHAFSLDKRHLDRCDTAILVCPAGKSCHLEFGYMAGRGKQVHILMPGQPDRFDLMYRFATSIWQSVDELVWGLHGDIQNVEQ